MNENQTDNKNNKIVVKIDADEKTISKYSTYLKIYKDATSAITALLVCYLSMSLIAGIITYFSLLYVLSILKLEGAK